MCVRMNGICVWRKKIYTPHQQHHHLITQLVFIGGYRILFYFIVFRCIIFFSLWIGNALVLHDVKKRQITFQNRIMFLYFELKCAALLFSHRAWFSICAVCCGCRNFANSKLESVFRFCQKQSRINSTHSLSLCEIVFVFIFVFQ